MTKSLADLRAKPPTGRALRSMTICLAPHLLAEVQALTAEHDRLLARGEDEESGGPPSRLGGASREVKHARDRLAALLDEMAEYEGELTLRANLSDGEWRRWLNANPPRGEDEPGHLRDERVTAGFCNADALIDDLATYVHQWNGEHITASDWADLFEPAVGTADKADMATRVVEMYESRVNFPQWRSTLSANLRKLKDSTSLESSASRTSDSTAGSPDEPIAGSTETATK